jgi:hypothetical protein
VCQSLWVPFRQGRTSVRDGRADRQLTGFERMRPAQSPVSLIDVANIGAACVNAAVSPCSLRVRLTRHLMERQQFVLGRAAPSEPKAALGRALARGLTAPERAER